MKIDAFPLQWPTGWKRTNRRKDSRFGNIPFGRARDELFHELKLMGVGSWNIILSTNIPLRRDGLPYAGQANPEDPGVAIYFKHNDKNMVFACDTFKNVTDNVWAIRKTIENIRGIQRWGASDIMERAFTGFQALPEGQSGKSNWWDILETTPSASLEEADKAWKRLAKVYHPDNGSAPNEEMMYKINSAWHEAEKELLK